MPNSNLLRSVTYLMDCFIEDYREDDTEKPTTEMMPNELDLRAQLEVNKIDIKSNYVNLLNFNFYSFNKGSFFFSCIWALGGTIEATYREQFSLLFRGLLEKDFPQNLHNTFQLPERIMPPAKPYIFIMPKDGLVFDYRFIKEVLYLHL